mgnify:CR=1 FL=1
MIRLLGFAGTHCFALQESQRHKGNNTAEKQGIAEQDTRVAKYGCSQANTHGVKGQSKHNCQNPTKRLFSCQEQANPQSHEYYGEYYAKL